MSNSTPYTVNDAAELLGVSRSNLYRSLQSGEIPAIRVGRSVRVPRAWVEENLGLGSSTPAAVESFSDLDLFREITRRIHERNPNANVRLLVNENESGPAA